MSERTSGKGTGRIGVARRMALLGLMVAAFAVAILGSAGSAGAQPITLPSDGWTPENFASTCKGAGGRVVEFDTPSYKSSICYFPGGGVNQCDWIKKTCTFGAMVQPTVGTHVDIAVSGELTVNDGSTGGKGGGRFDASSTSVRENKVVRASTEDDR